MILKIAIADKNSEYIRRILNVLETYGDIDVSVFTDEKSLKGALDNRKFDVLLFDESIVQGIVIEKKDMLSILLLDENNGVDESFLNFKKIYKYQRVSKIYQQILEAYSEVCGDTGNIIGQKATSVVSFYSPIGGCGKTTLALIAATKYAIQGYQCLYLNLEEMGSQSFYLPQSDAKGLSEMAANLGENINFTTGRCRERDLSHGWRMRQCVQQKLPVAGFVGSMGCVPIPLPPSEHLENLIFVTRNKYAHISAPHTLHTLTHLP